MIMSEQNNTAAAVYNQDGEETKVALQQRPADLKMTPAEIEAQIARAREIKPDDAPEVGILYWEANKGENKVGIFQGWSIITPKDKEPMLAAVIRVSPELAYMSAAVQIVSRFQLIEVGSSVYVECTESKSGGVKEFDVRLLERPQSVAA